MPARDYAMLQLYWQHEPWGAWRDNLHTAMLAREVLRPHMKKGAQLNLSDFMIQHPDDIAEQQAERRKTAARNLFQLFKSIAKKRPRT